MADLHLGQSNTNGRTALCCLASVFALALVSTIGPRALAKSSGAANNACPGDNGGITLSPGFCASVFADNLGHVRQMAVAPNGVLYANTWSGRYYRNDTPPPGGFLIALKDNKGTGRADVIERFGPGVPQAPRAAPALPSTTATSTPKRTTRSSATSCRQIPIPLPRRNHLRSSWQAYR